MQQRRKLRLPHPFSQPNSFGLNLEPRLKKLREPTNLFEGIVLWNGGQNGFVESASHQLHLPRRDRLTQQIKVLRMRVFNPLEQSARIMHGEPNARMSFERLQERQVGVLIGPFEDLF